MSKKKGLSLEEKRTKLLEIFTESLDVFQLKDLEKIAPKSKGITLQSVKEVLQSLVGDNLVDTEKIGSSIYFWSFPSKLQLIKKTRMDDLKGKVSDMKKKRKTLIRDLEEATDPADDAENRTALMEQLNVLKSKRDHLNAEVAKYKDCDPAVLESMKDDIDNSKDAVTRWTDAVFSIRSWVKGKTGNDEPTVNKMFNIPDDFDYPD